MYLDYLLNCRDVAEVLRQTVGNVAFDYACTSSMNRRSPIQINRRKLSIEQRVVKKNIPISVLI